LNDARWRLRALHIRWDTTDEPVMPLRSAFPARNRFLNFRSELASGGWGEVGFARLLRMWRRFDSRATLAPCRIALAAPPGAEDATKLWEESKDITSGGKRYFAWLRDRYYLDDGFGPMVLRANFALTVGFAGVHGVLAARLRPAEKSAELPGRDGAAADFRT